MGTTLAAELHIDEPQMRVAESDGRAALGAIIGKPVIAMTLTSAACPLTGVMENQIRTALASLGCIEEFRVDWQWVPAWRPADITDSGREQLRAIGFTI
jgi:metal-sulfur cluster biosynthetic enzyme